MATSGAELVSVKEFTEYIASGLSSERTEFEAELAALRQAIVSEEPQSEGWWVWGCDVGAWLDKAKAWVGSQSKPVLVGGALLLAAGGGLVMYRWLRARPKAIQPLRVVAQGVM